MTAPTSSSQSGSVGNILMRLLCYTVLAGVLIAGICFPLIGGGALAAGGVATSIEKFAGDLLVGNVPGVTTILDNRGQPLAYVYEQYRIVVPSDKISPDMKLALVSVEDKRFNSHDGVDWRGTMRAALTNNSAGEVRQGASTIDQQYIKNYQLLVLAKNEEQRRAATEVTPTRKLREIRAALSLERALTTQYQDKDHLDEDTAREKAKDEILTRYLNLVPFGNEAYGIEAASRTYFGISANELNVAQSAMLAGMVQSSSLLNPYTNPDGVTERRNTVLDTLIKNVPARAAEFRAAQQEPLGVLPEPQHLPHGCIEANPNNVGFFCAYVVQYLQESGLSEEQIERDNLVVKTTLDPDVQASVQKAVNSVVDAKSGNIAGVESIIAPSQLNHKVLAMASSRVYGLDTDNHQTVQPEPFSMVGDGAGSVFKIFTVAAAMEKGLGTSAILDVPAFYQVKGMGDSKRPGCPATYYCVKNAGGYRGSMSITDALATSPNTAFVKLLSQVGVPPAVDMAIRLGMRSYAEPGTSGHGDMSLADMFKKENLGSFTLGPTAINPLELSNVAATLASHGRWCPPTPIEEVRDRNGKKVELHEAPCKQAVAPGLADTLANALSKDDVSPGTSAVPAANAGWHLPVSAKTGTTETHRSSAFLAFTNHYAGAALAYGDTKTPGEICVGATLYNCGDGNLYGANVAPMWYKAMAPIAEKFGPITMPDPDPFYTQGSPKSHIPNVIGMQQDDAEKQLKDLDFPTTVVTDYRWEPKGTVISQTPSGGGGSVVPGLPITIHVSDGNAPVPPPPPPPEEENPDFGGLGDFGTHDSEQDNQNEDDGPP
ncbi:penicillin-binding protein [Segniliparus rugosus]|uniref:PASTA domain-containing protein n=1 Tax=Segniliparus rugosus (strain ATCC BAA-974 / DSM 45345 / CCUG 50838 / CIP 108380 / JCM 13579 / CDC 945) TaxID=679197 RepID=E5XMU9_SEGRC|nr:hypothetical protein HMPREF9336_00819 [Segniliparus rugosus ATCC BAA-974]